MMVPCGAVEANERLTIVIDAADYDTVLAGIYKILGCADIKNKSLLPTLSYQLQGGTAATCPVCVFADASHLEALISDCRANVERKKSALPPPTVKLVVDAYVCPAFLTVNHCAESCVVAVGAAQAQRRCCKGQGREGQQEAEAAQVRRERPRR